MGLEVDSLALARKKEAEGTRLGVFFFFFFLSFFLFGCNIFQFAYA
jgi:hypothetical protein